MLECTPQPPLRFNEVGLRQIVRSVDGMMGTTTEAPAFLGNFFEQLQSAAHHRDLQSFPPSINFYGGISGVIVLMWWIYFLAYFFVLGMALNVSKYESLAKDEK